MNSTGFWIFMTISVAMIIGMPVLSAIFDKTC